MEMIGTNSLSPSQRSPKKKVLTGILLAISIALVLSIDAHSTGRKKVLVVYPNFSDSSQQIFDTIIRGIEDSTSELEVIPIPVDSESSVETLKSAQSESKAVAVILLGKMAYSLHNQIKKELPVITGGLVTLPGPGTGVSIMGLPEMFLRRLTELSPKTKKVFLVYSETNNAWLMPLINSSGNKHDLNIVAREVNNPAAAASAIKDILIKECKSNDAIWLLMDRVVPDSALLPSILEEAWKKNLVVFSSNPLHVKRGVLFALFPDYHDMGAELGEMVNNLLRTGPPYPNEFYPTKHLRGAINIRTASHLGLHLKPGLLDKFDYIFPVD